MYKLSHRMGCARYNTTIVGLYSYLKTTRTNPKKRICEPENYNESLKWKKINPYLCTIIE